MARIVCVGIATLDQIFRLDAMPSRAEKYRARELVITGGGTAANAAVAAARLGGEAELYSLIGDDAMGDAILAGLTRERIGCAGLRRVAGRRSPLSAILVDRAGERIIISYADVLLSEDTGHLPSRLPDGTGAVLGDTRWQHGVAHFFRLARQAAVPAVLDGDRAPREVANLPELATHVAFSLQGARDLTGEEDAERALRAIGPSRTTWLAVTEGERGVVFFEDGLLVREPAFRVTAVDTLGAGDTWHGAFALALAEGQGERAAVRFANAAAALKCSRFGGREGMPGRAETEALLAAQPGD